jgi:glycosyltransferase involved in cell wall biosynthesis
VKILHLTADWKWTGPAEPMLHAIVGLRARGHDVDLACPEPPPNSPDSLAGHARERGVEPLGCLARRRGFGPLRDRDEVRGLRAWLRAERPDIVHVHHTRDHLLAWLAVRRLGSPLVASWHHGHPVPRAPWTRLRLGPRGVSGLVVLSEGIAEAACRGLGFPPSRLCVAPGVVDAERFRPGAPPRALREALGLGSAERVLGVVARLQPHRRFDLLLEAFARARREAPGLRLVVVGRGTRAGSVLEAPVARLGLAEAVVRAGYRRQDYLDVLRLLDALVFLVPGSDGSCRAVLEAMAAGVPTLASRRGVLPEIVLDGETGRVVDEEPAALAHALLEVWREPSAWRTRGKAARERVLARYTVARHAERLERFYAALVDGAS